MASTFPETGTIEEIEYDENAPENLPISVDEAKAKNVKKIRIRASTIATFDFCKPMAWLSIVKGIREESNAAMVQGSIQHYVRMFFNINNERIAKELDVCKNLFQVYDYMLAIHNEAVEWALVQLKKKMEKDNKDYWISQLGGQAEEVLIENQARAEALDQSLLDAVQIESMKKDMTSQAIVQFIYVKRLREFGMNWDFPKQTQVETELLNSFTAEDWEITISCHPDIAIMYDAPGKKIFVIDYKTGTPASAETWVEPSHQLQLTVYAWSYIQKGYVCSIGAINYTRIQGMLNTGLRPVDIQTEYFTNIVLQEILSWVIQGKKPIRTPLPYCVHCGKKDACKREFNWGRTY